MAKNKLLLNESITRRFMKLAEIKPTYVSNFLNEQEEEEEAELEAEEEGEEAELEPEAEEMDMEEEGEEEADMEMDMEGEEGMEEGGDAEALVMDLLAKIAEFAEENGVSMNIEGDDDEEMEDEEGMDMDMEGEEEMDMEMGEEDMGEEDMGEEDMGEEEANRMAYNRDMMQESKSAINENEIIDRVVSRVAKRLLNMKNK